MSKNIEWRTERRNLKDLKDSDKNPRRITKEAFKKLVDSLEQDGYHGRVMVDTNNVIIGGHQRKRALLKAGIKEIEVLVPSRDLTSEEFDRLNIRDNLPYGDFDFDLLANFFDIDLLVEWGMPEGWLKFEDEDDGDDEDNGVGSGSPNEAQGSADVWVLGKHRLMCGANSLSSDINRLVNSTTKITIVTDQKHVKSIISAWEDATGERAFLE